MCYSAGASFVASGGLAVIGAASLHEAENNKQRMIALTPLIFSIQQALEGFQWLSLNAGQPSMVAAYGFLFFAFLFWPVYVPSAIFAIDDKRRKLLGWLVGIGVAVALSLLWILLTEPLSVYSKNHSVCYDIGAPFAWYFAGFYLLATCGALLISSQPGLRWFGLALLASAAISGFIFSYVFTSVWCFFAAILSSLLYFYIKKPPVNEGGSAMSPTS